jgi:hypothetical protein
MSRFKMQFIVLSLALLLTSILILQSANINVQADILVRDELSAPVLHDISNPDRDGNFTVTWSSVPSADEYILREGVDGADDYRVYRGPNLTFERSNMPDGRYCYRVRAIILAGDWSSWSVIKCTVVGDTPPEPSATPNQTTTPVSTPSPTSIPLSKVNFLPHISKSSNTKAFLPAIVKYWDSLSPTITPDPNLPTPTTEPYPPEPTIVPPPYSARLSIMSTT